MKYAPAIKFSLGLVLVLSLSAWAEQVGDDDLVTFSAGTKAIAEDVNNNFSTLQSAINSTHVQVNAQGSDISDLYSELSAVQPLVYESCVAGKAIASINSDGSVNCIDVVPVSTAVISIPASALGLNTGSLGLYYDRHVNGVRWYSDFRGSAGFTIKKPLDYSGGDVTVTILFETTTDASGFVAIFMRPTSFSSGSLVNDPGSVSGDVVTISGSNRTLYEQSITIPASRLQNDWWTSSLQRRGSSGVSNPETYTDDVIVRAVALEYQVTSQ